MSEREKVYSESRVHPTPSGGVRSEIFYFDDHRNPVDKEEATACEILEYDEAGRVICSTIGRLGRKKDGNT